MIKSINFKDKIIANLINYKNNELNIEEDGVFVYRGKSLKKAHVLPKDLEKSNIIKEYRNQFYLSDTSQIDFHKYFHHLNSSQALCINLFFPLIAENKLDLILEALCLPKESILKTCFEKQSCKEIVRPRERKTSFDFYIELTNNIKIYFEIKYTENEFGKAKFDTEHIDKFQDTYSPLVIKNEFLNENFKDQDSFLTHYQIMRNLIHIGENEYVVFLYPKENKKINNQAQYAENVILNSKGRERFRILHLDKIVQEISCKINSPILKSHFKSFESKYLP